MISMEALAAIIAAEAFEPISMLLPSMAAELAIELNIPLLFSYFCPFDGGEARMISSCGISSCVRGERWYTGFVPIV